MFDEETRRRYSELREAWEESVRQRYGELPAFSTHSGLPIKTFYGPEDIDGSSIGDIGVPGAYPFTRSIYPMQYQFQEWMTQQIHGYGLPEDTRKRMDLLVEEGMTGYFGMPVFNLVFDLPSQDGLDPDDPKAYGKVGTCGISFCNAHDLEILTRGFDLHKTNFSLITGDTCVVLLAAYIVAAERQGFHRSKLKGNSMNWLLRGFTCAKETFPPAAGAKIMAKLVKFCTEQMPNWNTTNFNAYLVREAGGNAIHELGFTLCWAIATIDACLAEGLEVDDFAPRFGFQITACMDFMEEIAKLRALRRLWAKILKERYGAKNPKSMQARMHVHTAGLELTAQQPLNNIIRATIQALIGVLAGTNSLNVCCYDEAIGIPTEEAQTLALRTQQIIMHETNLTAVTDPLGGSYFLEAMTDQIERETSRLIEEVDAMGGFVKALEKGYPQAVLAEGAYKKFEQIRKGERIKVGLNKYSSEESPVPFFRPDPYGEKMAVERVRELRARRDNEMVRQRLEAIRRDIRSDGPLVPSVIDAVSADATLGEIWKIFKEEYGWLYLKNL
jgi:methylmalonyl-CoA mutase N-terminal domain/subunit